ncbi:hypothetical protein BT63DRAFT_409546 [Microthyrium microscopicum]|uniref:Uncharacterized protein n=1 Tax=Microthyrium microscopicum TaxID=703497 RepID=A0A6A6UVJ7_9PEZI|nr:hypothetical protein BT63DRAFT_409546 [Microthyrium microscopicum]
MSQGDKEVIIDHLLRIRQHHNDEHDMDTQSSATAVEESSETLSVNTVSTVRVMLEVTSSTNNSGPQPLMLAGTGEWMPVSMNGPYRLSIDYQDLEAALIAYQATRQSLSSSDVINPAAWTTQIDVEAFWVPEGHDQYHSTQSLNPEPAGRSEMARTTQYFGSG